MTTRKLRSLSPLTETDTIQPTGETREFVLEAKPANWEVVSGVRTDAYTFNGTVPGPTIRAKEGDTIRVVLKNSLPEETSIHWHGLHIPNKMDGVPSFTQHAIKPGETFTYEFLANHAGTYMYHSHFNSIEQIDKGMYGLLVIDPQKEEPELKHNREYTMLFGGWHVPLDDNATEGSQENHDRMTGMSKGEPGPLKKKGNVGLMIEHGLKSKDEQKNRMKGWTCRHRKKRGMKLVARLWEWITIIGPLMENPSLTQTPSKSNSVTSYAYAWRISAMGFIQCIYTVMISVLSRKMAILYLIPKWLIRLQ